jgi:hypothetical protein
MYSDIQRRIIETLDEMQYTPPTLQFNNDNTDSYECFTCPGGEKPPKEEFEAKLKELIDAQPIKELRQERNRRLAEVDWVFSTDYQIEDTLYKEWLAYRRALRDLPSVTEDPANPVWPEKPETPTGKTEGIQTPHFVATLMTENSQLRSKVTALERKSTKFELDIIDMKRRIQKVET